ncbi:endonuclease/exonuclease/phosphatase family protein [Rubrobacter marinus]|nr:endonuclease/exonuclease/phosphatase family protein [Rubrobacter marinus]
MRSAFKLPWMVVFLASLVAVMAISLAGGESLAQENGPRAKDREFRVMTYNIHHGAGADGRLDLSRTAGVIRASGAEVVGLQEVDKHWSSRSDFRDQARELADELGMHFAYGANLDLETARPDGPRRQYGTAILSQYPILDSENTLLPSPEEQRGVLEALINVRGVPLHVYDTHLENDSGGKDESSTRAAQIAGVLERTQDDDGEPAVILGDFNAVPDEEEMSPCTRATRTPGSPAARDRATR